MASTPPEKEKRSPQRTQLAVYKGMGGFGTLGLEIILGVGLGAFAGNWADGRLGTSPWLTLLGVAFGVATAVRSIQRALRMMNREAAREEREQGNPKPIFETSEDRSTRLREARKQRELKTGDEPQHASSNEPERDD
jgi:ATP synthase protein I